jgi:hypothetical protein
MRQQPSEVVYFSYWSIKPWFHTEGKLTIVLIIPSSWGFPTSPVRDQALVSIYPISVTLEAIFEWSYDLLMMIYA